MKKEVKKSNTWMILKNLFFFILAIFTSKDLRRQKTTFQKKSPQR